MKTLCRIKDHEYYDFLGSYVNIFLLWHYIWDNGKDNGKDFQKHHIHMNSHSHEGVGTIFLLYKCAFSELHSIRNRACRIWPILVPTLKCFGGICLFPLSRVLKELTVLAFLISSERLFQALIVEGKNELKKIFVRVRID